MIKVFHIESGLGNQMLDYADLVASRLVNPECDYYIETIIYECAQDKINMWQGYELERVFGIKEKNIKDYFSVDQWNQILYEVNKSRFWEKHWGYTQPIVSALAQQGLILNDVHPRIPRDEESVPEIYRWNNRAKLKNYLKHLAFKVFPDKYRTQFGDPQILFKTRDSDDYDGHYLKFKYNGNSIERIEQQLRNAFSFPPYDYKNEGFAKYLNSNNAVSIHARRGDLLGQNAYCYEMGYFQRATRLIKKEVPKPVFVFFCDTGSIDWCKNNLHVFGLSASDRIEFVDWNAGDNSYRDMQLMTECKHNIITESTFGWWGAYLNKNPEKITISPDIRMNTTCWV